MKGPTKVGPFFVYITILLWDVFYLAPFS